MPSISAYTLIPMVEIYPREGTETQALQYQSCECAVEIYPREGTETPLSLLSQRMLSR